MPEFVPMPAPVTATTFFDFQSESAISCSSRSDPGTTWTVGISNARDLQNMAEGSRRVLSRKPYETTNGSRDNNGSRYG